jgi:uncharacterized membrane protein
VIREKAGSERRSYLDWARGIAVLIMIQVHVVDGWTLTSARSSIAFHYLNMVGGMAAPLFLWLAGITLVLSAERRGGRTGERHTAWQAVVRRGLEVFVLAFAFRLQSYLFSLGASPLSIFRVDILNVMGLAVAVAGLLWGAVPARGARVTVFAVVALAIAMATPVIRVADRVSVLPIWFQWYLRPAGEHTTFTALPWAGFVFAGCAVGTIVAGVREQQQRSLHLAFAAAGAAFVMLGRYAASFPTIYRESAFWTSSPTFFAIRAGVLLIAVSGIFFVRGGGSAVSRSWQWLPALGRSSLFVYWVHVELVYGWVTLPLRRSLSLWQALAAWAAVVALMYALLPIRDRLVASWRARRSGGGLSTLAARP